MPQQTRRRFVKLVAGTTLFGAIGAGSASAASPLSDVPTPDEADSTYAVMGTDGDNPTATLYGNFKCPYTQRFVQGNLHAVIDEFVTTGELNLQFRDLAHEPDPSDPSHGSAEYYISASDPLIGQAALGVWDVQPGNYWGFFETMFDDPVSGYVTLSEMTDRMRAADVGNRSTIAARVEKNRYRSAVEANADAANRVGVSFTPTLELNGATTAPHHGTQALLDWLDANLPETPSSETDATVGNDTTSEPRIITVDGRPTDGRIDYEITVSGDISKDTANGATVDSGDLIDGNTAIGAVGPWKDSYSFTGEITELALSKETAIYIDGNRVDPGQLS